MGKADSPTKEVEQERLKQKIEKTIKNIEKRQAKGEFICGCLHDDCTYSEYQGMWMKLREKVLDLIDEELELCSKK